MKEILKKLQSYEIRIRKAINSQMQGNFHSIFKGSGLEFDDTRPYQYGDDTRRIDWNISAKGHGTYIKTFKEEKEQQVFFLLDVSASQEIGKQGKQKVDIIKEICGVLSLSSVKEQSQVGIIVFSDQKELYIKPGKGLNHAYEIIIRVFNLKPQSRSTNLNQAILFTLDMLKKRSVVIMLSDFVDTGFDNNLKAVARKHDLIVVHISDKLETELPNLGIIPVLDKESGKVVWLNTSGKGFKKGLGYTHIAQKSKISELCKRNGANYLEIDTADDFVPKLVRLFNLRNKSRKMT